MAFQKYYLCLSIFLLFHITFKFTKAENPTYLDSRCSNSMMFAPNTKYQTDLNSVFRKLTTKAATATATSATTVENAVYGLFLCRGDLTKTACKNCVATACHDLSQSYCPLNKAAVIWYTGCMVRYSNESFFGKMDDSPRVVMWNSLNTTQNRTDFKHILDQTMNDLVLQTGNSNAFYATVTRTIFGFWGTTAFSQCTSDLSRSDCTRCLKVAVGELPVRVTGRVLQPSCNVWYEVYKSNNYSQIKYSNGKKNYVIGVTIATLVPIASISITVLILCLAIRKAKKPGTVVRNVDDDCIDIESLRYDLATILNATNNFSVKSRSSSSESWYRNESLYPGTLSSGVEIMVERVCKREYYFSEPDFMYGMLSHARLQHKNLVRLLGFCVEGQDHNFLIFEPLSSDLGAFFTGNKIDCRWNNWETRFQIIKGIAKGVHYLHQDSRLKIIHRDLSVSNVLLDEHLNPKISGFRMAKILQKNDSVIEDAVRGTIGYISPEYLRTCRFSVESDVYSFGILILEIIIGRLNWDIRKNHPEMLKIAEIAREKWGEERVLEIVDEAIRDSVAYSNEIERCLHLALLCVEDSPEDRPTMETVVLMLESHPVVLPRPQQPAYMGHNESIQANHEGQLGSTVMLPCSVNKVSITPLEAR